MPWSLAKAARTQRANVSARSLSRPGCDSCVARHVRLAMINMSISRSTLLRLLSLHGWTRLGGQRRPQENAQFLQRLGVDDRDISHHDGATRRGVEHPQRNLCRPRIKIWRQAAADNGLAAPLALPCLMHPDFSSEPGMPGVKDYSRLGTMGVPLLACITRADRTRAMTARRPT